MKVQIPDDNIHQLHMTHQEISGSFVLTLVPSPGLCTTERCLVYLSLLIASAPRSRAYVALRPTKPVQCAPLCQHLVQPTFS